MLDQSILSSSTAEGIAAILRSKPNPMGVPEVYISIQEKTHNFQFVLTLSYYRTRSHSLNFWNRKRIVMRIIRKCI